jgi:16S rRNA (guanine1207-N2)-methyltransferase
MTRRRIDTLREVPPLLTERVKPPLGIVLGSPAEVSHLVGALGLPQVTCYQMDLYPAGRIAEELGEKVNVVTTPDLWDLPPEFQTLVYLPARGGERELKIDIVEQAFHVLKPHGVLVVWSPYEDDDLFPKLLKKVFGRMNSHVSATGTVLSAHREGDRPRRRHEVTFQSRVLQGASCRFLSRPGTFSYGHLDNGARALLETADIQEGDRVLDLGCGCGTNGVFAWQRTGPTGHISFVDSNVRALGLAEFNARANGITRFDTVATTRVEGLPDASFDVILANPPYFAQSTIARTFVERGQQLVKPEGRFFLVTKQPNETAQQMADAFGNVEAYERRGYVILTA